MCVPFVCVCMCVWVCRFHFLIHAGHLFTGDRFTRAIYRSPTLGPVSSTCDLELYYYTNFDFSNTTDTVPSSSSSSLTSSTEVSPYLLGAIYVKYFDEETPEGAILWSTIWNKGDRWINLTVGIGKRSARSVNRAKRSLPFSFSSRISDSINRFVCPSVGPSVRRSVTTKKK